MLWPTLTILACSGLVAVHLWWKNRCKQLEQARRREISDLTDQQKQAALQLQAQQDALLDSMADGLLLLDGGGHIQLANRAFTKLFGLETDLRSRTIIEALRLHELAGLVDSLTAETPELEHDLRLSAPNERWLQVSAAAIFSAGGTRQGTILVFHDLTRLKQLESARKDFVANVSHELRTPLSLIKGYVETLLDGARDNPEVAVKFLQTIDRNAERLKLLIEDLLTISELESGRVTLNLQGVALVPLAEKVFGDLKTRAIARNVTLLNQIPNVTVRADPDRLEQVLSNLVDNAIKYGRAGGLVTASGRMLDDGHLEVIVQDDGPGIPGEALERVFERFYRVDKARSREQGGTGLGLSIVKHIVQSHGGKVWAKSAPGQGCSFCFTLPAGARDLQQPLL
jgi:two-component system phosphate regulon sensor histidine kinase PhoR